MLDYGFWVWTVRRGAATLRYSRKTDRKPQKIVTVLKGFEPTVFPDDDKLRFTEYDTGIEKEGWTILLNGRKRMNYKVEAD